MLQPASLGAQHQLLQLGNRLHGSMERLSTGLAINRGADGPAALISGEALASDLRALEAATVNAQRVDAIMQTADAGMREVSGLLTDLDGIVVQASNSGAMSDAERDALQIEMDSILNAIDRVAVGSSFGGSHLLDGSHSYHTTNVDSAVADVRVHGASLGDGDALDVDVVVTRAASEGELAMDFGDTSIDVEDGESVTVEVEGADGSASFTFEDGATIEEMAEAINARAAETGVEASVEDGRVVTRSADVGSESFVRIEVVDDGGLSDAEVQTVSDGAYETSTTFGDATNAVTAVGEDIAGTVNGIEAAGRGSRLVVSDPNLSVVIDVASETGAGSFRAATIESGPTYQVGTPGERLGFGLASMRTSKLGRFSEGGRAFALDDLRSGGSLSLASGNLEGASASIRGAISSVATARGRVGAFQANTVRSAMQVVQTTRVNTAAGRSMIMDTDYAFETAALVRTGTLMEGARMALMQTNERAADMLSLLA